MGKMRSSVFKLIYGGLILFVLSCFICVDRVSGDKNQTVRVGYYPVEDYQETGDDGVRSGFGYDYYVQIQKYTRWNYEFVDASYADCVKMLAKGEIDMMCGMTDSPASRQQFLLSDYSNSNVQNKLYARADNANLYYESYDSFQGCKVATLQGMRVDELKKYAKTHHFEIEILNYSSYSKMEEALAAGTIDMVYASSISHDANTKIVARLQKQPLYYATAKNKPEIVEQLNNALHKIVDNNPEFYTQMSEKYKIDGANATATFTREELEYIRTRKQVYLIVNENWNPITWYDQEKREYCGMFVDIAKKIEEYSGLNIVPCTAKEFDDMAKEHPEKMGDCFTVTADDTTWAQQHSLMMSNHVTNTSIVMITKTGKKVDLTSDKTVIALPKDYYVSFVLKNDLNKVKIKYYDTVEQCFDAVNEGKADATYSNRLVSTYYLSKLRYNNLYTSSDTAHQVALAFGVYFSTNKPLLSIIDKSLLCIGSSEINQIIVKYSYAGEKFSLKGLYYSNPGVAIVVVLVICGLIGLIVYFRMKAISAMKRSSQEKTLARFMGYVCAANDTVLEVNLDNFMAQSYQLGDDGSVHVETFPYHNNYYENYQETIYPDDYKRLVESLDETMLDEMLDQSGGQRYFECRAKGEDGQYQWYSYSMQAIPKDKDHPKNFILFKKNIDAVKKEEEGRRIALEDALQTAKVASQSKGNFLSRVSHEIRTPLNAIIGYIMIARQEDSDARQVKHCLDNSDAAAKHLLSILNDVLDMSSIESGKMKLAKEEFDLQELIESLSVMFNEQTNKKRIHFQIDWNDVNQQFVVGDRLRVKQILINLLSNAVKFTEEEGTVALHITQMENNMQQCRIKFEVADTGIGMSKEYMSRLFQPFEQENAKTAQQFGGTGLGLSIAWNLVTMMGGSIDVSSQQGKGTTFTVLLTFDYAQSATKKQNIYDWSKVRVLVASSDKEQGTQIKNILQQCKVKCDVIQEETKVLKRIQARKQTDYPYQLCIVDWDLNHAKQIGKECSKEIYLAVVGDHTIQSEAKASGAMKVISKPVSQSSVFNLLMDLFGKRQASKQMDIPKVQFEGMHLLLVEDNLMNLEIATNVLRRAGLVVDTANNGKDSVQCFESSPSGTYQAILMDVQMPIMDGYEATRRIRESNHPQAKTIPIIAVSANAFSEDVATALACGMNGHISKPIDFNKLYNALEVLVSNEEKK